MNRFRRVFNNVVTNRMAVIGMVHVRGLPITPLSRLTVHQLIDISCKETEIYSKFNLNAICVENMFDIPYVTRKDCGPEVTSVMTRICSEVKKCAPHIPVGVQLLAGLNHEALAVAVAANLQFIRCESFVFGHIADEGYIEGCAGSLLRYRKQLNAENVLIFTDIKKKHSSHAITSDIDISEMAKSSEFFLSDGVIVTGIRTGDSPDLQEISQIKESNISIPVLIGSGVNDSNLNKFIDLNVDAVIVGSFFKDKGIWSNELSEQRIETFMNKINQIYDK